MEIGALIKSYENQQYSNYQNDAISTSSSTNELLKANQVIERYPVISLYGLNQAVKKNKIPIIKIGKLNFYDPTDIEKYINNNKTFPINHYDDSANKKEIAKKKYV